MCILTTRGCMHYFLASILFLYSSTYSSQVECFVPPLSAIGTVLWRKRGATLTCFDVRIQHSNLSLFREKRKDSNLSLLREKRKDTERDIPLTDIPYFLMLDTHGGHSDASHKDQKVTIRVLSHDEINSKAGAQKLNLCAELCVKEMFGSRAGLHVVSDLFKSKYGGKKGAYVGLGQPLKRQSVMLIAETEDGWLVGCCGMEMMLMTESGTSWWKGKGAIRRRPLISDLCVSGLFRRKGLGKLFLKRCEEIVKNVWEAELQAGDATARLESDTDSLYLRVDSKNNVAIQLYLSEGFVEVGRDIRDGDAGKTENNTDEPFEIYLAKDLMTREKLPTSSKK